MSIKGIYKEHVLLQEKGNDQMDLPLLDQSVHNCGFLI